MKLILILKKAYWTYKRLNLRGLYFSLKYKNLRFPLIIRAGCKFRNLKYVHTSPNIIINDHVDLNIRKISNRDPQLKIGSFVSIGRYSCIGCDNEIILEDHVRIAPYVHITDRNHNYQDISKPVWQQGINTSPILIGRETWIGYGSQIMPGVKIGKHCIIGAGSIVTKDIPDYSVAIGSPAKVVKSYDLRGRKWIKT